MEHLLSALEMLGVDNARIEVEGGSEIPIVDGSALGWTVDVQSVRASASRTACCVLTFLPPVSPSSKVDTALLLLLCNPLTRHCTSGMQAAADALLVSA